MTPAALLAGRGQFDCTASQTSFGPGDFWVRSGPLSRTGEVRVRSMSVWQKRATLYAYYADGAVFSTTFDDHAASRRIVLGAILEQPLPARAAPLVRLLWHIEGSPNMRAILRDPRIATPAQSELFNLAMAAVYAAFAGLCIALLCYNFAVWTALRHRFQLAYCAMVACLLLYAFSTSGALAWAWPAIANTDRIRVNYLMLGLSSIAAFAFARAFFERRVFAGRFGRIAWWASAIMLAATLGYVLFAQYDVHLFDTLYCWAFVGQLVVIPPLLWRAWRMRSNYLWLFAVAWAAPIGLASLRVANSINLISSSFWLDNSTILSMSLEALLSSIAIAYRLRLLSAERDAAREGEIAARLLADTDPLTGLLNRRAFLQQAIGRAGEQTLMIADLDHFKRVNETIGHDGGDEVLRVFARTLRQSLPPEALVARIGGEEFAIVTPSAFSVEPGEILARLRAGRMPYDVSVTASIGTCSGPLLRETDWKALYACADRALFEAKSAGRDRCRGRDLRDRLAA
ncbi:diguanylate cyclase domain-containing protein [Sphingomonas sp. MMS24-J45]|uniref:GGDEF domain-containing protein n=1 Tax=Sphingomonas sp. MMS24-J45 TaxID=3238806 RepID=UPI00384E6EA8